MYVIGTRGRKGYSEGSHSGRFFLWTDRLGQGWSNTLATTIPYFEVQLPYGVVGLAAPWSVASYEGRVYIVGGHTYNLLIDEHHRALKQGIRGPEYPPNISGATGTGNIAYLSWYDELTNERSPLSQGLVLDDTVPRVWQNLPTRPPDEIFNTDGVVTGSGGTMTAADLNSRVRMLRPGDRVAFTQYANLSYHQVTQCGESQFRTDGSGQYPTSSGMSVLPTPRASHLELWLSVAGGLPRLVTQVPIGTTSLTESLAAGELGETFIGSFERFPRCSMNTIYNDRQVLAGDPDNPDTVYLSELFYPERYAGVNFRTRTGDPVTGLLGLRDYCLVFTRDRTYILQGYTEGDFTFNLLEQSLGSVGHTCNSIVHGNAYIWTEKGPYMFNGSWHPLSPENEFSQPAANEAQWLRSVVDPEDNAYILNAAGPGASDQSIVRLVDLYFRQGEFDVKGNFPVFVFDYTTVQPEAGGTLATARLSVDVQYWALQQDTLPTPGNMGGYWYLSNKWGEGRLYVLHNINTGTESMVPYGMASRADVMDQQRVVTNADFSASYPAFKVILGHHYLNEVGGNLMEGKAFQRLWVEAWNQHPSSAGSVVAYPGDFDAFMIPTHQSASGLISYQSGADQATWSIPSYDDGGDVDTAPGGILKSPVCVFEPPMLLGGRGLTLVITMPNLGYGGAFYGWGGAYIHGPANRHGKWSEPQ